MAMGCPIVSTSIGMEGLPAEAGQHYLRADSPADFAAAVVGLLENREKRSAIAERARDFVEQNCSYVIASRAFEAACELAMSRHVTTRNR
jgi:glycosyltransferase involved in cell wall biosynthesis